MASPVAEPVRVARDAGAAESDSAPAPPAEEEEQEDADDGLSVHDLVASVV